MCQIFRDLFRSIYLNGPLAHRSRPPPYYYNFHLVLNLTWMSSKLSLQESGSGPEVDLAVLAKAEGFIQMQLCGADGDILEAYQLLPFELFDLLLRYCDFNEKERPA